jgi:predicted nuclease of predicted toxin-antitoxin system
MWLLDKNVPVQLCAALREFGVEAVTAESKAWSALTNGDLVAAAVSGGISCIVTRDRLFAKSAALVVIDP